MIEQKFVLRDDEIPRQWYNLAADLPSPMEPLRAPDGTLVTPEMMAPIFPMNLIEQEVSQERWIDIPEPLLALLASYRPAPLKRAIKLEKALDTPAKIYFKDESTSPAGSHKPNSALAQAWYNKEFGTERLTTETGACQWGSAICYSCSLGGLECKVFMVRISIDQKPYR
jgi:tryptophan synthase beta chain